MELLISIVNEAEAGVLTPAHCDILDVKDPAEGTIGAGAPETIDAIRRVMDRRLPFSVSIGDAHRNPHTMALALLGAARFQPRYLKVGLLGCRDVAEGSAVVAAVVQTAERFQVESRIIVVGYGDFALAGCLSPLELPRIAGERRAHGCMIDTAIKDGRSSFDHLSLDELTRFTTECRERGLVSALSGALDDSRLAAARPVSPDIMGVRGAVCEGKVRAGRLDPLRAERLFRLVHGVA